MVCMLFFVEEIERGVHCRYLLFGLNGCWVYTDQTRLTSILGHFTHGQLCNTSMCSMFPDDQVRQMLGVP